MDDDLGYRIRLRAHELWAQGGRPNASSLAFWILAEAELDSARCVSDPDHIPPRQQAARLDLDTLPVAARAAA